ncbi:hypothetical protein KIH27_07080 [Mycobacterium sp. M1]|uniref:Uncharacterized protein n=1 Tax=Mycolicibacter acidiphilus TaxID=2835306 RepID=A0ABS5RGD9_9MYCO|nr:hypothetical protein [Mycolicibacter acidiphilus]MBS9533353.1 hypothetical protein [Mycolicibacter acidiphilus]
MATACGHATDTVRETTTVTAFATPPAPTTTVAPPPPEPVPTPVDTAPAVTTTTTTTATSTESISSVDIETRRGDGTLTEVGPDSYQLAPHAASQMFKPTVNFSWTSHSDGKLPRKCTVVADVTGPGGYNQTRRSADCSGSPASAVEVLTPGTYTIAVSVTPPDGGPAVTATKTFAIVPAD